MANLDNKKINKRIPLILFALILFIYVFFAGRLSFSHSTSIFNYYSFLAESFLNGKLYFLSPPSTTQDLSVLDSKIYMYWGPGPILVIFPFVLLFGLNVSDTFYTSLIASFSPIILYFSLTKLNRLGFIKLSFFHQIILTLFFAFGSVHFYIATKGGVWFTSQSVSIFYILLSLFFIFRYVEKNNLLNLFISSTFFGLSLISRTSLIFYLPIFLALIFINTRRLNHPKKFLSHLTYFLSILAFFFLISGFYNYLRFESFLENGYTYHNFVKYKFLESNILYGTLDIAYLPRNFYYMFLNIPYFIHQYPFLKFDYEGNSIFATSPFLLLVFLIMKARFWKNNKVRLLNTSIIISILSIIFFLLVFWGTGWVQFSYRYFLDALPLVIILLAQVIRIVPYFITVLLLILSLLVNLLGTLWILEIGVKFSL